jgi:histidinol phosphatase-like PHP family hydrolase
MKIFSDMHVHTDISKCCRSPQQTFENILATWSAGGIKKIGLTDHIWNSKTTPGSPWYESMDGSGNIQLKKRVAAGEWNIEIMVGCEADTKAPGVFGITRELKEQLDYVVMSANHFHMDTFVEQPVDTSPRGIAEHMLEFFISAATSGLPDAIVHPLFPFGYAGSYDAAIASLSDAELTDAFGLAAENNVGIEINPCSLPNPTINRIFELDTPLRIFSLAKAVGCKFTFGSDAHSPEEFKNLSRLQFFADRLDLTETDLHPLAK